MLLLRHLDQEAGNDDSPINASLLLGVIIEWEISPKMMTPSSSREAFSDE